LPFIEDVLLVASAPFIGSFLGVVVDRLPSGRSVILGRSACSACSHALTFGDLVPILSWVASKGRCRHCGRPIGGFPIVIELAAVVIALWAVLVLPGWIAWAGAGFGWVLLTAAWIDARTYWLPDTLMLLLAAGGFYVAWMVGAAVPLDRIIGAAAGFCAFAGIAMLYRRLRQRDGLGLGDAKLLGAIGVWVGWQGLPTVIFFAAGAALVWLLAGSLRGVKLRASRRLPFGPFLGLGGWLVWLYGPITPG
jgi:leader peptidase (prepilin peptidase)/N-methyltransferase